MTAAAASASAATATQSPSRQHQRRRPSNRKPCLSRSQPRASTLSRSRSPTSSRISTPAKVPARAGTSRSFFSSRPPSERGITFRNSANSYRTSSRHRQSAAPSPQPTLSTPASQSPASQPAAQPTPPPSNSKPDATPAQKKPSTPEPTRNHGGIDGYPQVSSNQPPASATPTSTPASERTPVKSSAAPASASANSTGTLSAAAVTTPLPATSRTAAIASTSLPAGPVTQGAPLNQTMPEISSRARSTIHGTVRVVVKVRVDKSGAVSSAVPASSPSRFFSEAAVQAAKQWDFTPAKISGQPVPSDWLVRFDFTPTDTKVLPSQTKP